MKILVTGGAGFIGSNLIRLIIQQTDHSVINADKLTYAGNLASLREVESHARYQFELVDITDPRRVERLLKDHQPDSIMHLAAESHVDRSMDGPDDFIQTNIVGTFTLLQAAKSYYDQLTDSAQSRFRFLHVSTDEVFGSLDLDAPAFSESTPYDPHSPYSASKAASDHLVRVWHHTYGLPVLITNCSNNYGPYQFPEKLIPVVILKAIQGNNIPIYGKGENIRDWLFVDDHARALMRVLESGKTGSTYTIGSNNEWTNIDLVRMLCSHLDRLIPAADNPRLSDQQRSSIKSYSDLITFVEDRPGHDLRYAIDASKITDELDWRPQQDPNDGFEMTVRWYLENEAWWTEMLSGDHQIRRQGLC